MTLKQLTKLSVTNARSREGEAGRGCQIGEKWKKSSSFWAACWAVRLRRKKEREGRLWRQHHEILGWKRSQRKDAFMNYHRAREIPFGREHYSPKYNLGQSQRGRTQRKSNQFSFLRSFLLDTLRPGVFHYINTKYDTPPPWPNKKGFVPLTVGFNVAASEAARGLLIIYSLKQTICGEF